ncbi:MAG: NADH-ubiquinone oxidoreductase-F iron-sulfur binding region domain-containing protein [Kineosporiaceae bacterium]
MSHLHSVPPTAAMRMVPGQQLPRHPFPGLLDGEFCYSAADRSLIAGPDGDDLGPHLARCGPRPVTTGRAGEVLLRSIDHAGLTGRGGAHFPVATKWRAALAAGGGGLLVANGAEGEPASAKDTALLQHRPHLVIDGLVCAAETIGAARAVIWLHEGAVETHRVLAQALAERRAAGFAEPAIRIVTGPDRYLTGEASAVVRALDGGPALPAFTREPAATRGVHGLPTVVQNVETLARVALLARAGADAPMPGVLVTVHGESLHGEQALTVRELAPSRTVAEAVLDRWGPRSSPPQAILIGGYGGSWLPWAEVAGLPLGRLDGQRSISLVGQPHPSLGAGVLIALPTDACGLTETAAVIDYLAASSAKQCGPCLFGTRALADGWRRIADSRARRGDHRHLLTVAAQVAGRGACHLPDAVVGLTRTALRVFADDLDRHLRGAGCGFEQGRPVLPMPGRR